MSRSVFSLRHSHIIKATIVAIICQISLFSTLAMANNSSLREQASKLVKNDNYKEALEIYTTLLDQADDSHSARDLNRAIFCLSQLNRTEETDSTLEENISKHSGNIPLIIESAHIYLQELPHYGTIIAGKFKRGNSQSGGQYANSQERDRIRSMQLCLSAIKLPSITQDQKKKAYLILNDAILMNRQYRRSWKLQILSDISKLPDYEIGNRWGWGRGGRDPQGAPVTPDGSPLFYNVPTSWNDAKNDGERWRFVSQQCLSKHTREIQFADFLKSQFAVTTMGNYFSSLEEQKGILQLHTLKDNETIAKLANGIKRFTLPDDQNFITIYKKWAQSDARAADELIRIYLNRRQHDKAVELLKKTINQFPSPRTSLKNRKKLLRQIIGNWGKFDIIRDAFPTGKNPTIDYIFRNASEVTLSVRPVDTNTLINNLWKYLEKNPSTIKQSLLRFYQLNDQLVNGSRKKYVGKEIARKTYSLTPRPHHWDTLASLQVPIDKAGTYLVTATLKNGNTCHILVWIDGIAIVKKSVKKGTLYYVTDATTGKIIPSVKLEFFGYRQLYLKKPSRFRRYKVITQHITKTTGDDGILLLKTKDLDDKLQWMVRAKTPQGTAMLGFSRFYSRTTPYSSLNSKKSFGITDRPVYQPNQKVFGKFWIRQAQYDLKEVSTYAGKKFTITILDPMGTKVVDDLPVTADSYGGVEYSYKLPDNAKLGRYRVVIQQKNRWAGYHFFRVEEYKKPEYQVSIEAPKSPIILGETFEANVKATYYHGAPVTEAKVHVKVMRTRYNDVWFPVCRWDWLYGNGYGWLDIERPNYPGWKSWRCACPRPFWFHQGGEQPEIVFERDYDISPDGSVSVKIDTAIAKAIHGDTDHKYTITAEVVDASRRTIVGSGSVIAARKAYQVNVWLNRGFAHVGETLHATVSTRSADGKLVPTQGKFILYQVISNKGKISEKEIQSWKTQTGSPDLGENGKISFKADRAGQFRLASIMTDKKGHTIEGAILFTIRGHDDATGEFTYSDLELIPDKRTYAKGESVKLLINTQRPNSVVMLSLRGGESYQFVYIKGQSAEIKIPISQKDMPNFFIEAATVSNAKLHTAVREIIVPPEKRILNVEVLPSQSRFKPQSKGKVKVRITDEQGSPVKGSLALTIYDKSLEYISRDSNVSNIKEHFWKWRRRFSGYFTHSLSHHENNTIKKHAQRMIPLGTFGFHFRTFTGVWSDGEGLIYGYGDSMGGAGATFGSRAKVKKSMTLGGVSMDKTKADANVILESSATEEANHSSIMVRKNFADLVKWVGSIETNNDGEATIPVVFPDNLTTWKIKTWAMAQGTRVGEGSAEVITSKDLIIRLQAPRFFIEKDELVLSAIVHNYHANTQDATISLEVEGGTLTVQSPQSQQRQLPPNGESRIDWRCKVTGEGKAIVRMKVVTANDSDAMEMTFPVYVHGILKQESWSDVIRPEENQTTLTINVPAERQPDKTRLEIRYSPTIAGSIIDAIPYLADFPYGCTEQTLNRFVPSVIAQKVITEMNIDLEAVRNKRTNLNPQEIGDDKTRMAQWNRWKNNPVFSKKEVQKMVQQGVTKLNEMQLKDGGWGWFSGYGEQSYPHTTAVVVHGLLIAKSNGANIPANMLQSGINWLKNHEAREVKHLKWWKKKAKKQKRHAKEQADATDALTRLVLAEAGIQNHDMLRFLFRDKSSLSLYAKALTGMSAHLAKDFKKRDALIRNIEQFLVYDNENQSAYLNLKNNSYWWHWQGDEIETQACFLKLLVATKPTSKEARGLVKYLVNNRRHATYWKSTRDTAFCIEAIADFMRASGENTPNADVTIVVDGKVIKTVKITKENLFSFDNKVVIAGDALGTGIHHIQILRNSDKQPAGPLYTNAYLTVFTKENLIKKAGLEIKVERAYYRLKRIDAKEATADTNGQVVNHKVEKYQRIPLKTGDTVVSGDLIEVELHIFSKNDYEYLMFNDWKPAGLEAVTIQSGYTNNGMHAYMEAHHEKTSFFVQKLTRGEHSLKYRLRAEIPGTFSALPTQAEAMYAPELKANSDEIKIKVIDR